MVSRWTQKIFLPRAGSRVGEGDREAVEGAATDANLSDSRETAWPPSQPIRSLASARFGEDSPKLKRKE